MDSEDICLSVFFMYLCWRGYGRQNQADYTHWLSDQRGAARDFVKISPDAIGRAGRSKRFCQNKPRRYQISGA